jgi:predicted XRE-type DNA-binding protein
LRRRSIVALDPKKKARIREMGGRITTVEEWLDLSGEEVAFLDMKIRLGEALKDRRRAQKLSQAEAAELLGTSQGRVSKLERGLASLDQLAWSWLALGGSREELAQVLGG